MATGGLAWVQQDDFAAGMMTSVAGHLIPANGVRSITDGLLDDDGSVYKRGGTVYASDPSGFDGLPLTWIWHGDLVAGARTVFANDGDFGVLNGTIPVNLGGPGLSAPVRAPVVNGMVFISGGWIYGGSLKAVDYLAASVTLTQGSKTVTGSGFTANVDPGMLLEGVTRYHVVKSVDSNTQVTLEDAWEEVTATVAVWFKRLGSTALVTGYRTASLYATVAERLVTIEGSRIYFSNARDELGVLKPHVFSATDYHELPEGATGLGAEVVRDLLVVFSTDGIWTINNMTFDLTDAAGNVQQSMQRTSQDIVVTSPAGVASYAGSLVVPAADGVYLVDGVSAPVSIGDAILSELLGGIAPGAAAVFKGHYLLPIGGVYALACRLNRPVRIRGRTAFPWVQLSGHAGRPLAFTVAAGPTPRLLAAGVDGRVLDLHSVFVSTSVPAQKTDADGTVPSFEIETRDFATGTGNVNTVRRARVRYEMEGTDDPGITAAYWDGESYVPITGEAGPDTGVNKYTWNFAFDARFLRLRIRLTDPAARLTIRSIEIAVRSSAKDR